MRAKIGAAAQNSEPGQQGAAIEAEFVRANVHREVVEGPGFASLYANDTQVQLSPWDVRLIFGIIDTPASAEHRTIRVKTTGEVRMSLQHAKKVAEILVRQLGLYEKRFGPISIPE
jgi:hypothetical protein